jgi:branched-chain amino acid aminotransferase
VDHDPQRGEPDRRPPLVSLQGRIVEEDEARISPFDRGFLWGDGVYEVTPCVGARPFRLDRHLERLARSLRYLQIDPGLDRDELEARSLALLEANASRLEPDGLYRLLHVVTRGLDAPTMLARDATSPTVCIAVRPVRLERLGRALRAGGVDVTVVPTRRVSGAVLDPRAKVTSRVNAILGELDAAAEDALSLMVDAEGWLTEHAVANVFLVAGGRIATPPAHRVLEGVTRATVLEVAADLGIAVDERDLGMYDVAQADEAFLTSSGFGVVPVRRIGRFGLPGAPGPMTAAMLEGFVRLMGVDVVARAIEEAEDGHDER